MLKKPPLPDSSGGKACIDGSKGTISVAADVDAGFDIFLRQLSSKRTPIPIDSIVMYTNDKMSDEKRTQLSKIINALRKFCADNADETEGAFIGSTVDSSVFLFLLSTV